MPRFKDDEMKRKARDERDEKKRQRRQEELDNKLVDAKREYKFKSVIEKLKFETYTKRLVGVIVFVGLVDLQLSYVLAFLDKIEIAENLSTQVCTTILGTALIYMIRAYFDTKAEKADEKSTINKDMEDRILENVRSHFYDAGIEIPSDADKLVPKFVKETTSSNTEEDDECVPPTVEDENTVVGVSEEEISAATEEPVG